MIDKVSSGYLPTGVAAGIASPGAKDSPAKIKKAAEEFEALLIGQMLKSAHETGSGGWLGAGKDQGGQTQMDLAEEQFANLLASKGGLGLSKFIISTLGKKSG